MVTVTDVNLLAYLDLLGAKGLTVHGHGGSLGVLLAIEGDEGETLAGVVHVGHHPKLLKLILAGKLKIKLQQNTDLNRWASKRRQPMRKV
jgi:hypothetical protein